MKKEENMMQKVGSWAFIIGVVLAIIAGVAGAQGAIMTSVLIVLGVIVGFLNVTAKETTPFLLATVSLVIVTSLGGDALGSVAIVGKYIGGVFGAIMTFVIPATIIVALKAIYALASEE